MWPTRMTTLAVLHMELSPHVIFANDWAMILCLLYDFNVLCNILTIPSIYLETEYIHRIGRDDVSLTRR